MIEVRVKGQGQGQLGCGVSEGSHKESSKSCV